MARALFAPRDLIEYELDGAVEVRRGDFLHVLGLNLGLGDDAFSLCLGCFLPRGDDLTGLFVGLF